MASLDDVYDMTQRLEDSNIEYLLITITKGKKQGKADVFYYLKNAQSMRVLSKGLEAFNKEIDNIEREEESDDE
jgi:hypothetical protein